MATTPEQLRARNIATRWMIVEELEKQVDRYLDSTLPNYHGEWWYDVDSYSLAVQADLRELYREAGWTAAHLAINSACKNCLVLKLPEAS